MKSSAKLPSPGPGHSPFSFPRGRLQTAPQQGIGQAARPGARKAGFGKPGRVRDAARGRAEARRRGGRRAEGECRDSGGRRSGTHGPRSRRPKVGSGSGGRSRWAPPLGEVPVRIAVTMSSLHPASRMLRVRCVLISCLRRTRGIFAWLPTPPPAPAESRALARDLRGRPAHSRAQRVAPGNVLHGFSAGETLERRRVLRQHLRHPGSRRAHTGPSRAHGYRHFSYSDLGSGGL